MEPVLAILAIGLVGWFWADNMRAREQALVLCARACERSGAQLLDQTVALKRLRLTRDAHGRLVWQRSYAFEYSVDGAQRLRGSVLLRGRTLEALAMSTAEGITFFNPDRPPE